MTDHWICTFALIAYEAMVDCDFLQVSEETFCPKFI
jgi:hypothetical protein